MTRSTRLASVCCGVLQRVPVCSSVFYRVCAVVAGPESNDTLSQWRFLFFFCQVTLYMTAADSIYSCNPLYARLQRTGLQLPRLLLTTLQLTLQGGEDS